MSHETGSRLSHIGYNILQGAGRFVLSYFETYGQDATREAEASDFARQRALQHSAATDVDIRDILKLEQASTGADVADLMR